MTERPGGVLRDRGFTLLEITITISILGLLLGVVYGVFARVLSAKELVERRAEESAFARSALERMTRDVEATIVSMGAGPPAQGSAPPPQRQFGALLLGGGSGSQVSEEGPTVFFESADRNDLGVSMDELGFSALVWQPSASGAIGRDMAAVRYFILSDPDVPARRSLYREMTPSLNASRDDDDVEKANLATSSLVLENVAGLRFRFHDGDEWVEEWDSKDSRNFAAVPRAVEIALTVLDADGDPETFRTSVDVPASKLILPQAGAAGAPGAAGGAGQRRRKDEDDDDIEPNE